jgi:hypothetical protein
LPATLCCAAATAAAQVASGSGSGTGIGTGIGTAGATGSVRPDPLDACARVPALGYRSSFAGFVGLRSDVPLSWREANDAVARIGGWRTYAREAQQPEPAPAGAAAPAPAPAPAPALTQPAGTQDTTRRPSALPGHAGHKSP